MRIEPYRAVFQAEVIELIGAIQRDEFDIDVSLEDQPDLLAIESHYQTGRGNFWAATIDDRVVGTIALLDIGERRGALRKMFVRQDCRGPDRGIAGALLSTLLGWAREHEFLEIFLGTTPFFLAAHRFYEKHGFVDVGKEQLPVTFPIMKVDTKFYRLRVPPGDMDDRGATSSR